MSADSSLTTISVIVPKNPFLLPDLRGKDTCLAALDVMQLMDWWPGKPHTPHRDASKVSAIQRSLDWKRVAQIAAYLLQDEIVEAPKRIDHYFREIYEPVKYDPGREWPPRLPRVVGFPRSEYPTFSSVLLHVNGARIELLPNVPEAARLVFSEDDTSLNFQVIDGQHRINGAFLAVNIMREKQPEAKWEIPSEIFLDLDARDKTPRRQAQIFIDINFYQKKVDRSLVDDLFPTARGEPSLSAKERAQDLGRKLMLEIGPLVGMIQIPGIKFGVKDVVTLATLNSAIEDILDDLNKAGIETLDEQAEFLALCLDAWLEATGRREDVVGSRSLDPENVAYQGRVIVSFLTLLPGCIWRLKHARVRFISRDAKQTLIKWLREVMHRANLLENGRFVAKGKFKQRGYLGSGGLARFRDTLWIAALASKPIGRKMKSETLETRASAARGKVRLELAR